MIQFAPMNEIIFLVEEAPEGGFVARALGESIFTEADDLTTLEVNIRLLLPSTRLKKRYKN